MPKTLEAQTCSVNFWGLATLTEVLSSRPLTKTAVEAGGNGSRKPFRKVSTPPRKKGRRLNAQVKPLDVDLAVGAIARNDQKTEPVDMALKISIGLFAWRRNST
jgi:hypothetical protein